MAGAESYVLGLMRDAGLRPQAGDAIPVDVVDAVRGAGMPDAVAVSGRFLIVAVHRRYRKDQASYDGCGDLAAGSDMADNAAVRIAAAVAEGTEYGTVVALGCTGTRELPVIHPFVCRSGDPDRYVTMPPICDLSCLSPKRIGGYLRRTDPAGDVAADEALLSECRGLRREMAQVSETQVGRGIVLGALLMARLGGMPVARLGGQDDARIVSEHRGIFMRNADPRLFETRGSDANRTAYTAAVAAAMACVPSAAGKDTPLRRIAVSVNRRFGHLDRRNAGIVYSAFVGRGPAQALLQPLEPVQGQRVLDPFCGNGGVLVSALEGRSPEGVLGTESDPGMFAVAVTSMILAGADTVNVAFHDSRDGPGPFRRRRVDAAVTDIGGRGMSSEEVLSALSSMLSAVRAEGRVCAAVPMAAVSCEEGHEARKAMLASNRLDAVVRIGDDVCVVYMTAGVPQGRSKVRFLGVSDPSSAGAVMSTRGEQLPRTGEWWSGATEDVCAAVDESGLDARMRESHRLRMDWTYMGCGYLFGPEAAPPRSFVPRDVPRAPFRMSELFSIEAEGSVCNGSKVPSVVPSARGNGWDKLAETDAKVHRANRITVSFPDGAPAAFFQPCPFVAAEGVTVLRAVGTASPYALQYLAFAVSSQLGSAKDAEAMMGMSLTLPAKGGRPDFSYMGNRAKFAESEYLESLGEEQRGRRPHASTEGFVSSRAAFCLPGAFGSSRFRIIPLKHAPVRSVRRIGNDRAVLESDPYAESNKSS